MTKLAKMVVVLIVLALIGLTGDAEAARKATPAKKASVVTVNAQTDLSKILAGAKPATDDRGTRGKLTATIQTTNEVEVYSYKLKKVVTGQIKKGSDVAIKILSHSAKNEPAEIAVLGGRFQPEQIFTQGWKYLPDYNCWIGTLASSVSVDADSVTAINRQTGKTYQNGAVLAAGTEIKLFRKQPVNHNTSDSRKESASASVETRMVKTADKDKNAPQPEILSNSRYLLQFSGLAAHDNRPIDLNDITSEQDLALLSATFTRNSFCPSQVTCVAERAVVARDGFYVRVATLKNGKVVCRDARDGEIIKPRAHQTITIWLPEKVARAHFTIPDSQPEVVVAQEESTPAVSEPVAYSPAPVLEGDNLPPASVTASLPVEVQAFVSDLASGRYGEFTYTPGANFYELKAGESVESFASVDGVRMRQRIRGKWTDVDGVETSERSACIRVFLPAPILAAQP